MELVNYTLQWVWQVLDEVLLNKPEICRCDVCRHDMACLAANRLKPNYAVSDHGQVYIKSQMLKQQTYADVLTEVLKAVEQVSKNPHHLK